MVVVALLTVMYMRSQNHVLDDAEQLRQNFGSSPLLVRDGFSSSSLRQRR